MKDFLFFILLFLTLSAQSQSELWSKKVSKGTLMHQLDNGKILLKDKSKIFLVNHQSGKTEWERRVKSKEVPQFLEDLPIIFFEDKSYAVIDAISGFIIDESSEKTKVLNISYYWEKGRVILELKRDNRLHILNTDLKDLSKSWNTKVGEVRKTKNEPLIIKDGSLVLVDKKIISIVSADGSEVKRVDFNKRLKVLELNIEKNILYVLEDKKKLHWVNLTTGEINATFEFDMKNLKLRVLGDGSTIAVVIKNELRILDGILGMQLSGKVFNSKIYQAYIDETSGKFFVLSKSALAELDHATGDILREAIFDKGFDDIYTVYDKTIIGGANGISPINLTTLELEFENLADIPTVHDYVESGEYTCYTNHDDNDFTLSVVDRNGNVVWDDSFFSTFTPSIDVIGNGLLVMSGKKVKYLNIETGKSIWQQSVDVDPSFVYGMDEETNDLFMYSEKRLYKFDYSSRMLLESKDKFKFKDFDYSLQQPQLIVNQDAIFLKGSNTVFVASKNGEIIHEKSYERISNGSTFLRIVNVIATAAIIGTGNSHEFVNVYPNTGLGDVLFESWNYADDMEYYRRIKQNRSSRTYPYVFTKLEKDKRGLIFINPSTGEERVFVVFDEKDPNYIVDNIDGVLFHLNNNVLTAYDIR